MMSPKKRMVILNYNDADGFCYTKFGRRMEKRKYMNETWVIRRSDYISIRHCFTDLVNFYPDGRIEVNLHPSQSSMRRIQDIVRLSVSRWRHHYYLGANPIDRKFTIFPDESVVSAGEYYGFESPCLTPAQSKWIASVWPKDLIHKSCRSYSHGLWLKIPPHMAGMNVDDVRPLINFFGGDKKEYKKAAEKIISFDSEVQAMMVLLRVR